MNHAIKERLRFLEFLVESYDSIGRKQIMNYFGVSPAQATRDFQAYKKLAPDNLIFDDSAKKYRKSLNFKGLYNEL
jgi:hypothetical protein